MLSIVNRHAASETIVIVLIPSMVQLFEASFSVVDIKHQRTRGAYLQVCPGSSFRTQ